MAILMKELSRDATCTPLQRGPCKLMCMLVGPQLYVNVDLVVLE